MARPRKAWTSSADIHWFGELDPAFQATAEAILGQELTPAAWGDLERVVRAYSLVLNHEVAAAPIGEQQKALKKVHSAAAELILAIDAAETLRLGHPVRTLIADEWEKLWDHEAQFEHDKKSMVRDISALAVLEDDPDAFAWQLMQAWLMAGRLVSPDPVADFRARLGEFTDAARLANVAVTTGTAPSQVKGAAFQEFIGRLYDWKHDHRIDGGATRNSAYGKYGRLTELVKAILAMVPELRDENGKLLPEQMRRPLVADSTLADQIIDAHAAYVEARPAPVGGIPANNRGKPPPVGDVRSVRAS